MFPRIRKFYQLLGYDSQTNNETTAIAMQQFRKYARVRVPLLRRGTRTAIELLEAVFSMQSVPRCFKQDKSRI
jgi:hypothetical protein